MANLDQTSKEGPTKKAECSQCGGVRNCDILGHHNEKGGNADFQWWKDWYLLRCRGCEYIFVEAVSSNSEDYDQEYNSNGEIVYVLDTVSEYWPGRSKRKWPEWMTDGMIETDLRAALLELYKALDNDLNMLAAIGIRTSFDIAAELLGVDPNKSFDRKLQDLVSSNHIGEFDHSRLETLVNAGNASVHRGWRPDTTDLNTMMDVLEHFIQRTFVEPKRQEQLDAKITKVKATVPIRKSRQNAKSPSTT